MGFDKPAWAEAVIDYDETQDHWVGICSEHGEVIRQPGTPRGHDVVVYRMAAHQETTDWIMDDVVITTNMLISLSEPEAMP
jgi:hypothetical protein